MDKNEVNIAFEILLEEIEKLFNILNKEIEEASNNRDYEKARRLIEYGEKLKSFREEANALRDKWLNLFTIVAKEKIKRRKEKGRLKRGLRTPQREFYLPILKVLINLGGKAQVHEVLRNLEIEMKDILNNYDLQHLTSNPNIKRWENTAGWARYAMVKKGLLKLDSPPGIWEISEEGRNYYESNKND